MIGHFREWWMRLLGSGRSARGDAAIDRELAAHLQMDIDAQIAAGLEPEEARRHAVLRLGGLTQVTEACRERQRFPVLSALQQDVRLALRHLRRHRGFTAAAVLTLGLGVGATTAIFSVVHAVLLTPLPYPSPERRVLLFTRWISFDKTTLADQEIVDFRARATTLTAIAAWDTVRENLTGDGDPVRVGVGRITANTFEVLGVQPRLGRSFSLEEDRPNGEPVAVLGHALWQTRYGGDPAVVGRTVLLDDAPVRVIGVMPDGFVLPTDLTDEAMEPSQLWRPLQIDERTLSRSHGLFAAALLAPGESARSASAELGVIAAQLTNEGAYPAAMRFTAFAVSVDDEIRGGLRPAMWLLTFGVACLLMIACANVANLLLVRGDGRRREMAVRAALGGSSQRLFRQLLTENGVLACAALLIGVPLAWAGLHVLTSLGSARLPTTAPIGLNPLMLLISLGLTAATTVAFGLVPAARVRGASMVQALRDVGAQTAIGGGRIGLQSVLVVAEVALAVVLLVGAGLMVRSLVALNRIDLGFDPAHVVTMRITLSERRYASPGQVVDFYRQLGERTRALPGVVAAGSIRLLPLATTIGDWGLDVEGYEESPGHNAKGDWQVASEGAFEAMGTRLRRGRWFTPDDRSDTQPVAVVNETLARAYWRTPESVIGGRIRMGSDASRPWATVIGIVADERHNGVTGVTKEKFYIPYSQWHIVRAGEPLRDGFLVVRTTGDPMAMAAPLREVLRELDPNVPATTPRAMTDVVAAALGTPRLTGFLLTTFAAIALTLAAIGIYGVLAYFVSARTRELGIRLALGSRRSGLIGLVVGQGLRLAVIGVVLGLAAGLSVARWMGSQLYAVTPADPVTFVAVSALLLAVAGLASAIPAIRAARLNPMVAMRTE